LLKEWLKIHKLNVKVAFTVQNKQQPKDSTNPSSFPPTQMTQLINSVKFVT